MPAFQDLVVALRWYWKIRACMKGLEVAHDGFKGSIFCLSANYSPQDVLGFPIIKECDLSQLPGLQQVAESLPTSPVRHTCTIVFTTSSLCWADPVFGNAQVNQYSVRYEQFNRLFRI